MLGGAYGRRVVAVCGRGNNGADGRVAGPGPGARGARVRDGRGGHGAPGVGPADLVIDAAYGTGFRGEYRSPEVEPGTPVLAVDIPSGVTGDTGQASGAPRWPPPARSPSWPSSPVCSRATGPVLAGEVSVADIGLPPGDSAVSAMEDGDVAPAPAPAPGRQQMVGRRAGGGRITRHDRGRRPVRPLGLPVGRRDGPPRRARRRTGRRRPASEAVSVPLPAEGWSADGPRGGVALLPRWWSGPGLGRQPASAAEVQRLVAESPVPVVVDADGLFALGLPAAGQPLHARSTGGADPPRRRVRAADGRPSPAPTGSPRPGGWPSPRVRWPCSRGRRRRWPSRTGGSCSA